VGLTVVSNSEIEVNFTSPLSDGGSAINSYEVLRVRVKLGLGLVVISMPTGKSTITLLL
jgi:hypothetical protein